MWGQKVRDVFPRLKSNPKTEGCRRPRDEAPFVRETRIALRNLPGSSDLLLYCHLQHHNDTIKKDAGRLLYKYMYLSLYCKGSKRVTQGLRVRGSWRPNITAKFDSTLMAVSIVSFLFS